jgi:hypothetical protein
MGVAAVAIAAVVGSGNGAPLQEASGMKAPKKKSQSKRRKLKRGKKS